MLHNIILLTIKSAEILRPSYVIKLDMSTLVTVHQMSVLSYLVIVVINPIYKRLLGSQLAE